MTRPPRVADVLPELCAEICQLLRDEGEHALAAFLPSMPFIDWCGCGDDFCQSFRTASQPAGAFGPGHRSIPLLPDRGMIVLDVQYGAVMYVEVIGRPETRNSSCAP